MIPLDQLLQVHLLVIADNPSCIAEIGDCLNNLGFETVVIFPSITNLPSFSPAFQPELALVDLNLSGPINWLESAQYIQDSLNLPLLFLDSSANTSTSPQAVDFIAPPFNAQGLRLAINLALYQHRLEKKLFETEQQLQATLVEHHFTEAIEREQRQLAEIFQDTVTVLNTKLDLNELLERILTNVGQVVPHDTADIMLLEAGQVRIVGSRGYVEHNQTPVLGLSFALAEVYNLRWMAETGKPLVIPDTHLNPHWVKISGTHWVRSYAAAPIRVQEQVIGFLNLCSAAPYFYTQTMLQRLQVFAEYVGIALNNARLLEIEREQREFAEILRDIVMVFSATLDFNDVLDHLLDQVARVAAYDTGNVFMVEGRYARAVRTRGHEQFGSAITQAAANLTFELSTTPNLRRMIETAQPFIIPDTEANPDWLWGETWHHVRSWVGVPIMGQGQVIAYFSLDKIQPNFYQPKHAERLALFAGQVALALENSRLFEATARRRDEAEALRRAALALTSTMEMDQVLSRILAELQHVVPYDSASVQLFRGDHLEMIGGRGFPNLPELLGFILPIHPDYPNNIVLETKAPLIIADAPPYYPVFKQEPHAQANIHSWMGVPLLIGDRLIGMLTLDKHEPDFYVEAQAQTALTYAAHAAIAIENARLYVQVQHHATELEQRVQERTFELQTLYELAQTLNQATQLSDIIRLTLLHLYQAIPYDVSAVLLITQSTHTLVIQSQRQLDAQVETHLQEIMLAPLVSVSSNKPLEIHRIKPKDEQFTRAPLTTLASLMQVQLTINQTPIGLLLVAAEKPNQFTREQMRQLRTAADQATESIRRLQSLLAAEHQRLENLVAHLPDGVILLDSEQHIVLANQLAQHYLNLLTTATVGDPLTHLGRQSLNLLLAQPLPNLEIESETHPRQIFRIDAQPVAVGPEKGGWILVIRNVTQEKATQKLIRQQDRLAAVGQLAAGIAHDFNNILTSIIGFTELVLADPHLPALTKGDLQRIVNQGQRAAKLVRQILDFSRQSISEKQRLEVGYFLKETIKLLERTIPENIRITLTLESEHALYLVNADPAQLQQALTNLAVNARDAMPEGGFLQFKLAALYLAPGDHPPYQELYPGSWITLTVADTGQGMSAKILPHIFEPFFTTKDVGKGTGLGLAQVYGIITQHNGYIEVQTQLNQGTTFSIYLPAIAASSKILPTPGHTTPVLGHGEVILLVEDDLAVLEVIQAMLKHLGYKVVTAANGRQALEIYQQHHLEIALVLTDVTMPEMGGLVLAKTLKAGYPSVKVIAISGYPLEVQAKDVLSQGVIEWLQKPLNKYQLAQTLSQYLQPTPHEKV